MQKLKQLIAAKKASSTNQPILQRDVVNQHKQRYLKQQQQLQAKQRAQQSIKNQQLKEYYSRQLPQKKVKTAHGQDIPAPNELKLLLRSLHQPITYFGESQHSKHQRYLRAKKFHQDHPEMDMRTCDEQFQKLIRENQEFQRLESKHRSRMIQPSLSDDLVLRKKKIAMVTQERQPPQHTELCQQLLIWFIKVLRQWGDALKRRYPDQQSRRVKAQNFLLYQQASSDLHGLIRVLRTLGGDHDMMVSLYHIMNSCLVRQYVEANNRYIDLSVGTAPWPMGVAMLGITVKKNSLKLSHVLNTPTTRRWMQGIKRLLRAHQELFPNQERVRNASFTAHPLL